MIDRVCAHQLVAQRVEEGLRLVRHDADAVGDRAGPTYGGREHVGVAVVDGVVAAGAARLAQLGAGGQDHHARARTDDHGRPAHAGQQPELARAQEGALLDQEVTLGDVLAGGADVLSLLGRSRDDDLCDSPVGPLVGHDRVGPRGHGRAGHDLDGRAGRHRQDARLSGPDLTDDRQVHGTFLGGGDHVVVHHGVAVHRRVVEARQGDRRRDVLGRDEPQGVEERLVVRRERAQRVEDQLLVLGDRPQRRGGLC